MRFFYYCSIVTMVCQFCIISEIPEDSGQKIINISYPYVFLAPSKIRVSPVHFALENVRTLILYTVCLTMGSTILIQYTSMTDGQKNKCISTAYIALCTCTAYA